MIFSGTEKLFFLLGLMTALIIVGLYVWNKTYKFKWNDWTLLILGFFFVVFSIAWAISSVLEGETRAASMGIVFFAIPGLLILTFARRLILKRVQSMDD